MNILGNVLQLESINCHFDWKTLCAVGEVTEGQRLSLFHFFNSRPLRLSDQDGSDPESRLARSPIPKKSLF